jgi:hypothetical protein
MDIKTQPSHFEFAPIPPDEMGFAMALFVSASSGRLSPDASDSTPRKPNHSCEHLFMRLMCSDDLVATSPKPIVIKNDLALYSVFRVLWENYEGDERQASVCARVLAFHFLMERTSGAAVEDWLTRCPAGPESVMLDCVVVEALARICLLKDGLLDHDHFQNEVESIARVPAHPLWQDQSSKRHVLHYVSAVSGSPVVSFPFECSDSRLLAERLLAFEASCVGDNLSAASRVCRKLRGPLDALTGVRGFESLVARAKALTKRDCRVTVSVIVEPDGSFQGLAYEGADAAAVFIGHLIGLPDRLIGKGLTLRLLQVVWPNVMLL